MFLWIMTFYYFAIGNNIVDINNKIVIRKPKGLFLSYSKFFITFYNKLNTSDVL